MVKAFILETPLLWACYCGQYDFFMYLLSQKAEIRAMSANDTTCLIGACVGQEASRLDIVKHILKLSMFSFIFMVDRPK